MQTELQIALKAKSTHKVQSNDLVQKAEDLYAMYRQGQGDGGQLFNKKHRYGQGHGRGQGREYGQGH